MFDNLEINDNGEYDPFKDKKLMNQIRAAINQVVWLRWEGRVEAKELCKHYVKIGKFKNGNDRFKVMYKCMGCNMFFEHVHVDHIKPRIPVDQSIKNFDRQSIDDYVERTFVKGVDNLQVLCYDCHEDKTKVENSQRQKGKRVNVSRTSSGKSKSPFKNS